MSTKIRMTNDFSIYKCNDSVDRNDLLDYQGYAILLCVWLAPLCIHLVENVNQRCIFNNINLY